MTTPTRAREPLFERPGVRPVTPRDYLRDMSPTSISNAIVALIFSASGPVAVILTVGVGGGLTASQLASWLFGIFVVAGLMTLVATVIYRRPLAYAWTIPGTVLLGPVLASGRYTWAEVIGTFYATGALILLLSLTGLVRKVMDLIPMPIVMAMVAGVFLKFGTDLVQSVRDDAVIAGVMVLVFLLLTRIKRLGKYLPPVIGALLVGAAIIAATGKFDAEGIRLDSFFAQPEFTAPQWNLSAMIELVIPLAITVLVVQNGQGTAILRKGGHEPPVNTSALISGLGTVASATVGAIPSCLTGATNAILISSGRKERQYTAAITLGFLMLAFGILAPTVTQLMLAAPQTYLLALGGMAMLPSLLSAFTTSFRGRYVWGALITFVVTVSGVSFFGISSAFWGLVVGYLCSRIMEPTDYHHRSARSDEE